ncbi:MAG: hypothetical protein ABIS50_07050 [Luteolibacter sp.]|uniref:hypothetical protein n=1 Tax=Luteolibacter sp. TaxID=1962973 RepID=UPI003266F642
MKLEKLRISIAYGRGTDPSLAAFAGVILASLYSIPALANPPVPAVVLEAGTVAFNSSITACADGGPATTAEKNNRRAELVTMLDRLAYFVLGACGNDLALLLSSGFQNVSTNRAQSQLPKPNVIRIDNGLTGQSLVTVQAVPNARCFELQYAIVDANGVRGEWLTRPLSTSSRNIPVDDLTPGVLVAFQARAVGGLTGYSDWSDVVTHRAA